MIVAVSAAMRSALQLAERFAPTEIPILIVGPTGAGKEVVAQEVHRLSGRTGPLVDVNCAALPRDLVEGELFGHRRGAFTGAVGDRPGLLAEADGGTLFLDELCSLPLEAQGKLLRVLETGEFRRVGEATKRRADFRLVTAAHRSLDLECQAGRFRPDLVHRVAGVTIAIPPLAERSADIVPLATHFAARHGRQLGPGAAEVLCTHRWPGNVRELRTAIERACVLRSEGEITAVGIVEAIDLGGSARTPRVGVSALVEACRANGWHARLTAQALGISRATLFRRLKAAGVRLRGAGQSHQSQDDLETGETMVGWPSEADACK